VADVPERPLWLLGWKGGDHARAAVRASIWSGAGFGLMQVLRAASTILVANRIFPDDLALFSLVAALLGGLNMLSDLGIAPSVVQSKRGDEPNFLDTAFVLSAARGVSVWALAALLAYPFALFYKDQRLFALVLAAAASVLFRGAVSPAVWTLSRHVQVRTLTLLNVGSELAGFAVAVTWARFSPSAWALVAGTVSASLFFAVASYAIGSRRPRLIWDKGAAQELIHFGVWMFLSTATYFAGSQAERLVLGKYVSKAEFGCFSMALMMATAPTAGIQQLFSQVFFPMISRLRRDHPDRALMQFRRSKWLALVLAAGVAAGSIVLGPWLVRLLLKPDYAAAGWMLQLLGFRAALDILAAPTANLVLAYGLSKYAAIANMVRVALLAPGLWITLAAGDFGAAVWVLTLVTLGAYATLLAGVWRVVPGALKTELVTMLLLIGVALGAWWFYRL
jgi:O-antigen/teichoic acid export membrane protein